VLDSPKNELDYSADESPDRVKEYNPILGSPAEISEASPFMSEHKMTHQPSGSIELKTPLQEIHEKQESPKELRKPSLGLEKQKSTPVLPPKSPSPVS
jgi:hypothetical protein